MFIPKYIKEGLRTTRSIAGPAVEMKFQVPSEMTTSGFLNDLARMLGDPVSSLQQVGRQIIAVITPGKNPQHNEFNQALKKSLER